MNTNIERTNRRRHNFYIDSTAQYTIDIHSIVRDFGLEKCTMYVNSDGVEYPIHLKEFDARWMRYPSSKVFEKLKRVFKFHLNEAGWHKLMRTIYANVREFADDIDNA